MSWDFDEGAKLMEHSYLGVVFPESVVGLLADRPARVVWAGDYADDEPGTETNLYVTATGDVLASDPRPHRFIVNLDREEYVDTDAVAPDQHGYKIHPLPLLTCEGNGRGGGDFMGNNEYVGAWSRDLLAATDARPNGLEEIIPNFSEDQ